MTGRRRREPRQNRSIAHMEANSARLAYTSEKPTMQATKPQIKPAVPPFSRPSPSCLSGMSVLGNGPCNSPLARESDGTTYTKRISHVPRRVALKPKMERKEKFRYSDDASVSSCPIYSGFARCLALPSMAGRQAGRQEGRGRKRGITIEGISLRATLELDPGLTCPAGRPPYLAIGEPGAEQPSHRRPPCPPRAPSACGGPPS